MVPVLSKQQTSTRPAIAILKGSVQKIAEGSGVISPVSFVRYQVTNNGRGIHRTWRERQGKR